jgi:hypothetical protein
MAGHLHTVKRNAERVRVLPQLLGVDGMLRGSAVLDLCGHRGCARPAQH